MKRGVMFFLCCMLSVTVFAQDVRSAEAEVTGRMNVFIRALMAKDSVALSDALADDVSVGHTNGSAQTKRQMLDDVISGTQYYKSIETSDMLVRIHDNVAIVTMKTKVNMLLRGSPVNIKMNDLYVWTKKDNVWRIIARQAGKI
jgi:ketosteroid isomerase-like protein